MVLMVAVLQLLVHGFRAVCSICQAAAAVGSRATGVFRLSNGPCLQSISYILYGEYPRMDVRHIWEGLGTKICSITRVAEAADGLKGQKMNTNAFDDLEETPFLPLSSASS